MTKLFKEFTAAQLARLKKEYEPLRGQRISMNLIDKMNTMLSKYSTDMLVKLANTDIPFIATAAKNIAVVKRGKKWSDFKTKLDMAEADELQCEACWDSHKQVGTKISSRTGKRVPNCVPKEELQEVLDMQEGGMKDIALDIDSLSDKEFKTKHGKSKEEMKKSLEGVQEALDKDDKETIKPIIKQLQKSVKAHGKQAKQLQKDIKDEVEITEASADFLRLEFEDADEVREFKKDMNRGLYRVGNRNQSARYGLYDKVTFNDNRIDGFSVELEGMEDADKFMKLMKRDGHEFTIDMREEVELTEAVSDAQVVQIARMTDRNDHFGVRIEIARLMKDKQLMSFYDSLEKMHMTSQIQNAIGNDAVNLRGKLEKVLKVRMKQRFGDKDSKRIMDAL